MSRCRLPDRRLAESFEFEHGTVSYVATVGRYADGRLGEIFLSCTKAGSALDSAARDAAIIASLALQHGADPEALRHALGRNSNGAPLTSLAAALDLILVG